MTNRTTLPARSVPCDETPVTPETLLLAGASLAEVAAFVALALGSAATVQATPRDMVATVAPAARY